MPARLCRLLVLLALCAACASPDPKHNLVLITLDTTRADHLACYGHPGIRTPNMDELAQAGTRFERAFAVAPITAPSHASILTGTYPLYHGVHDNGSFVIPDEIPLAGEILQQAGYTTAAMVSAYPVKGVFGFNQGFDYFSDTFDASQGSIIVTNIISMGMERRSGGKIAGEFKLWLKEHTDRPFFVWLHFFDPHRPYDPVKPYFDLYAHDHYQAEIAYVDDCIGQVMAGIAEAGLAERTGIIIVGDHGEGLDEHNELTHAILAYNATLHVPLIMSFPWIEQTPVISENVSQVDILPTLLESLDVPFNPPGSRIQGISLYPAMRERGNIPNDRVIYFETFFPFYHFHWAALKGIVKGRYKLIQGVDEELFDLQQDFSEQHPLKDAERTQALGRELESLITRLSQGAPAGATAEMDRDAQKKLAALGYIGHAQEGIYDQVPHSKGLPNPRENMHLFSHFNNARNAYHGRNYPEARRQIRRVLDQSPTNKDAKMLLADTEARMRNFELSDRLYGELIATFQDSEVLLSAARYYFLFRDKPEKAAQCLDMALRKNPKDYEALTLLAQVHEKMEHPGQAREYYEAALALNPKALNSLVLYGIFCDRAGDTDKAHALLARAVSLYPFHAYSNYSLGVFLLRQGSREGISHLEKSSIYGDNRLYAPANFALARYYAAQNQTANARHYLDQIIVETQNAEELMRARQMLATLPAE